MAKPLLWLARPRRLRLEIRNGGMSWTKSRARKLPSVQVRTPEMVRGSIGKAQAGPPTLGSASRNSAGSRAARPMIYPRKTEKP